MNKCTECGSYAINHHCHGRDGSDPELCDVCYWRVRAEAEAVEGVSADDVRDACANAVSVFAEEANADQCREAVEYMREVLLALIARRTALAASTGQEAASHE